MKYPVTSLFFITFVFTQNIPNIINNIESQIDSMSHLVDSLSMQKNLINVEIIKLNQNIKDLRLTKKTDRNDLSKLTSTTYRVVREAKLRSDSKPKAPVLLNIPSKSTVVVFNEYINGFYKVRYQKKIGYLRDAYFGSDYLNDLANYDQITDPNKKIVLSALYEKRLHQTQNSAEKTKLAKNQKRKILIDKYGERDALRILNRKIWLGMTKEMAIQSIGNPTDIKRTVFSFGVHELWVYSNLYLHFEDGVLNSWQD